MVKYILSCGMGQNSVSLAIWLVQNKKPLDFIIFADTGAEEQETYNFLPYFQEWCKKVNIPFIIVKSKHFPIYDYYYNKKCIPTRMFRHCTHKFKIIPVEKYLKANYPKELIYTYIGIGSDESKRKRTFENMERELKKYVFPFVDEFETNRKQSIEMIKKEFKVVPIKSGCYFCPFQSKKSWVNRINEKPKEIELAIKLEKNVERYPEISLMQNKPLEKLKAEVLSQMDLTEFFKNKEIGLEKCGYCTL